MADNYIVGRERRNGGGREDFGGSKGRKDGKGGKGAAPSAPRDGTWLRAETTGTGLRSHYASSAVSCPFYCVLGGPWLESARQSNKRGIGILQRALQWLLIGKDEKFPSLGERNSDMRDHFFLQIIFFAFALLFSIGCWPNPATVYMSGLDAVLEERPNIRLADSQDIKEIKKRIVASLKSHELSLTSESRVSRKEYSDYRTYHRKTYPKKEVTRLGDEDDETAIWRFAGRCHAPDKTVNAWELIVVAHGRHIWVRRYNDRPGSLKCQPQFAKDWVKIIAEGIRPATIVDPFCRPLEGSMWVAEDYKLR